MLGDLFRDGRGVPQDVQQALACYQKAAQQEDAKGQVRIGRLYLDGKPGLKQDERKAAECFRQAAMQHDAEGEVELGLACVQGRGVSRNLPKGVQCFRLAAQQGNPRGQLNLGQAYRVAQASRRIRTRPSNGCWKPAVRA